MTATGVIAPAGGGWRKLAALLLALAAVGLPVNTLGAYVLLPVASRRSRCASQRSRPPCVN